MRPQDPLLARWSIDELQRFREAATRQADSVALGSTQEVLARGNAFFASYCLGGAVDDDALQYARACIRRATEEHSRLLVAWRLIVQVPPDEVGRWAETIELATQATERALAEDSASMMIAEPAIAMRLVRGDSDRGQAQGLVKTSAHHRALWALGLPPDVAMGRIHDRFTRKIRAAEADGRTNAAIATLGPLGWQRGVAWLRLRVDEECVVPTTLRSFFSGFPAW